jgi:hypothetical protein
MGTVYRARDPQLDREVALKTIAAPLLADRETLERFRREARAAARLSHPNIVTIYELGEWEGTHFIAMELLEGLDLAQAMTPVNRLTSVEKLRVIVEVCRGLDFAHKHGVVHRDVKPANIRLLKDGTVRLVDFGIARLGDSSLTQAGMVLGTPSYIAPEVLTSGRVDHRADIWAVGVILFELLSGRRPFEADNVTALAFKIVRDRVPTLDVTRLGLPPILADVAARALAKNPHQRYQEAAEIALAVAPLAGLTGDASAPPTGPGRRQGTTREIGEARQLLDSNDLEGALAAARRARALEPSHPEVLGLIETIERRLGDTLTLFTPGIEIGLSAPPREPLRLAIEDLRARGATVLAERGLFGEPPSVTMSTRSPTADRLAVAGTDGAVRLWDLNARTRILTLRSELHLRTGHEAAVVALAFSPDGALLASGHVDGAVHVWDVSHGSELPARLRHEGSVGALAFSPDGRWLASGGVDATVKLWDVHAAVGGDARRELLRQPAAVTSLTFAAHGGILATGHANRVIRLVDAQTLRLTGSLRGPGGAVDNLCASPDGKLLAGSSPDRTLRLFDLEDRRELWCVESPRRAAGALAFCAGGHVLISVALDNALTLWDLESPTPLATLWGARGEAFVGATPLLADDGLAAALADGHLRLWGVAG